MKDHVSRANWSVAAIGLTATALILWLAISFWLDARNQKVDAANILAVNKVESALLDAAINLAVLRTELVAGNPAQTNQPPQKATGQPASHPADTQLQQALLNAEQLLEQQTLQSRLHFSSDALQELIAQARNRYQQMLNARQSISEDASSRTESGVGGAVAATVEHISALIRQLHNIQTGLRYLPVTEIRDIERLRALRSGLRDLGEMISAETVTTILQLQRYEQQLPAFESPWQVNWQQIQQQLINLQQQHHLQNPEQPLLMQLDKLTELWLANRSEQSIAPPDAAQLIDNDRLMRGEVTAILNQLNNRLVSRAAASRAHGVRRLVIDTLLIIAALWIVLASVRLVSKIRHQAYHDRLTNLPNRFRFEKLLHEATTRSKPNDGNLSVAVLDIDNFKLINNSLGHAIGNQLLIVLGERLSNELSSPGQLARLSADEFAIVIHNHDSSVSDKALIEQLMAISSEPFDINGATIKITVSAGLCQARRGELSPQELVRNAELAMHRAKTVGKNCLVQFDPDLGEQFRARIALEVDLHLAIETQQLSLHYQPKVNTATGCVDGVEALIRWQHPQLGMVPPFKFIPIAEQSGLIVEIGSWVLQEACRQNAEWQRQGLHLQVAINVSAEQFAQQNFVELVDQTLQKYHLDASSIELEVTESVGVEGMTLVVERLHALRALNISVAIDDFGTGYSSLQYLDDLPLDKLKIDRAFISKIDAPADSDSLVTAVMSLAKTYGLKTVAEGVETEQQLARVTELGCDYIQGYYHSRPVSAEQLPAAIKRINSLGSNNRDSAA